MVHGVIVKDSHPGNRLVLMFLPVFSCHLMIIVDSFERGYTRQDNFPATTKPAHGVGDYRANSNLEVALHYLFIGTNPGSVGSSSTHIGAIIKWVVVVNREPDYYFFT